MSRPIRWLLTMCLMLLTGCDDMSDQPKQKAYSPQAGPAHTPSNTVEFQSPAAEVPAVTMALLERGQQRYRIYCTPCHSELGDGKGMIVQRGFPSPPPFFGGPRRSTSPQHVVQVITDGYGAMYAFADRVQPSDRWAIAAYLYALERSQHASLDDMAAELRGTLK